MMYHKHNSYGSERTNGMYELKCIPTDYNGYTFRSRAEVRWAHFFDLLGIQYSYEPDGYEFNYYGTALYYEPDFLVGEDTGEGCFFEIKPRQANALAIEKAVMLSKKSLLKCFITVNDPVDCIMYVVTPDGKVEHLCYPESEMALDIIVKMYATTEIEENTIRIAKVIARRTKHDDGVVETPDTRYKSNADKYNEYVKKNLEDLRPCNMQKPTIPNLFKKEDKNEDERVTLSITNDKLQRLITQVVNDVIKKTDTNSPQ